MLLAIDTSTNYASLALADGESVLAELNWRVGQHHGSEILERARWLLRGQGVEMRQLDGVLDGVSVALGPGSFNGVRVAVATAKTLAFALGVPLWGVPTLDVIAWGARLSPDPIWALLDAGRGEVYAAYYDAEPPSHIWAPLPSPTGDGIPYRILTPEALAAEISGKALFTGEWRVETAVALKRALGSRAHLASQAPRRGAWLVELTTLRAERDGPDDPRALEPLYLRRPNITKSARTPSAPAADQPGGEEAAHAL